MEKSIVSSNSAKTSHFLGVDFGKTYIGLALADKETKMAFRYGTIYNNKDLVSNLKSIVEKESVAKVIIGIPSYINREEVEYEAEKLGEYLRNVEHIDVEYENEMFSTVMAKENLRKSGIKNLKELDHEEAARIILQSWLDRTHSA